MGWCISSKGGWLVIYPLVMTTETCIHRRRCCRSADKGYALEKKKENTMPATDLQVSKNATNGKAHRGVGGLRVVR